MPTSLPSLVGDRHAGDAVARHQLERLARRARRAESVTGSTIMPLSERLTLSTSAAWSSIDRLLVDDADAALAGHARSPCAASVTVSIAAETSGMRSAMSRVSRRATSTSFGRTADCRHEQDVVEGQAFLRELRRGSRRRRERHRSSPRRRCRRGRGCEGSPWVESSGEVQQRRSLLASRHGRSHHQLPLVARRVPPPRPRRRGVGGALPGARAGPPTVQSEVEPGRVRAQLPPSPPEQPEPFEAVLDDLDRFVLPGLTHWQHPGFYALLPGGRVGAVGPRRPRVRRARRAGDALGDVAGLHGAGDPRPRLDGRAARAARAVHAPTAPEAG